MERGIEGENFNTSFMRLNETFSLGWYSYDWESRKKYSVFFYDFLEIFGGG